MSVALPSTRWVSPAAALALAAVVFLCSIYANLSFTVADGNFSYFPPFKPQHNGNQNQHLGAEYYNIAKALVAGDGFANPFAEATGPTAWMPPVLPLILAGLIWLGEGDKDVVTAMVIFLQVYAMIATGLLVLALAQRTTRIWPSVVAALFVLALVNNFHLWFQVTHDYWLILLTLDLLVASLCWLRPLANRKSAAGWGVFGAFCALVSPVAGFCWGILTGVLALRQRAWRQLGITALCAALGMAPWTMRNLIVFGRLIPVKSNAAYELYQTQCLQPDGLLQARAFSTHPYSNAGPERQEYKRVGEMAFLDHKRELFWKAFWADPEDFADRVASRFLGTLLWYEPFNRDSEPRQRPLVFWWSRLVYPLPFLGALVLAFSAAWKPLAWPQWGVLGIYLVYLLPYIAISYYNRYAMPLVGVKVLLIVWGADRLLDVLRRRPESTEERVEAAPVVEPELAAEVGP
jgi:hypothetical protein